MDDVTAFSLGVDSKAIYSWLGEGIRFKGLVMYTNATRIAKIRGIFSFWEFSSKKVQRKITKRSRNRKEKE